MKTIVSTREESLCAAAERLLSLIEKKPQAVIALGAGEDELALLRRAAALAQERGVSLSEVRFLAVCEFEGEAAEGRNSARRRLAEALSDAAETEIHVPDAADPAACDAAIARLGGIDLAVLGLGENARVGFNEPATPFDSHTHVQKLTDRTRRELAPLFGGEDKTPQRGVTMGFRELCAAREILVIALGEEKSKALYHMLYGRDDSVYPAAFLQLPPNVTVYADEAAAAQTGEKGFDLVAMYGR